VPRSLADEILEVLARVSLLRDGETQRHAERMGALAHDIGRELGVDGNTLEQLRRAAPLHDIGKVAVPDAILLKPGPLDPGEMAVARRHTVAGAHILSGASAPEMRLAAEIALTHHERWDGRGYPSGLAGDEIPLAGRIVAVADVFDALIHERPYKTAWPVPQAITEIRMGAGTQFDPDVVAAFLAVVEGSIRSAAA
jgi:putative two-component system response regulator